MMNRPFSGQSLVGFLVIFFALSLLPLRAEEHSTFIVGDFTFTRPTKWEWVPTTSEMRKAQLKVSDAASQTNADVVFFQFGPGGAGGVKANVNRWLGQFSEPREQINAKIEDATIGKTKVTFVQAEGTYSSGMPGGPHTAMPNYALAGAIVQSDHGDVFVRMTGPKELVKSEIAEFRKMIESGLK